MCGPPYVVRRRRSPECLWQRMKVELNGGGEERVLALSGHADFIGSARRSIPRGHRALYAPLASAYGWDCARACASVGAFPACVQNSGQTAELASLLAGPPRLLGLDDSGKRSWAGWQWLKRVSLEANVDVPLCGGCASCPRPSSLVGPQFCVCRRCTTAVGIGGCTHTTLPARPRPSRDAGQRVPRTGRAIMVRQGVPRARQGRGFAPAAAHLLGGLHRTLLALPGTPLSSVYGASRRFTMLTLCSSREAFERIQLLPLKEEARRSEARAVLHLCALRTFESRRDVLPPQRPGETTRRHRGWL